ncbi:nucleotidyl transferase AbiEii/AbiGii toxin family protein [Paraburkholderia sp. WC7.3g]|uniref:nucleotidyl transferase AbiEii/AbiGii toxin family protein n=1 Tax=Paraburkholderia sp. WC7.3g TaxID=2991070 RepID=UPI003D25534A
MMTRISDIELKRLAAKYIWWNTPDEAAQCPDRVITQVMNLGSYSEVEGLVAQMGSDALRHVLTHAKPGEFNERSWAYWNYRLGLADIDHMPPMPTRKICVAAIFTPHTDVLPPAQRRLWPELSPANQLGFVLYGGTAIALRLGHRPSVDFDFFTHHQLDKEVIRKFMPFTATAEVLQDRPNTYTILVRYGDTTNNHVRVSFFGGLPFGRVADPEMTDDGVLQVAALDDLMAHKAKVIRQRFEAKDYRDIAAMVDAGVSVGRGIATARQMFGVQFQPIESLKAMVCFQGGDLATLSGQHRQTLITAVRSVKRLPDVSIKSSALCVPVDFHLFPHVQPIQCDRPR